MFSANYLKRFSLFIIDTNTFFNQKKKNKYFKKTAKFPRKNFSFYVKMVKTNF